MIVYNITAKVSHAIEGQWVAWQQEEHIPAIMATGNFTEYKFYRLLDHADDEGITYIIQYFAPSMKDYETYINNHASALREDAIRKWGNQFIAFRTVMEVVN